MDHDQRTHLDMYSSLFPSSSSIPRWSYDVFLSFRGEDTRDNFTDHLYTALVQAGIHTFRDDDELPRGHEISCQLLKAIQESRISIVVFSKNYAYSRWCLDELVSILECKKSRGQLVLPVFYDVDPSDVRRQTGTFGDAFAGHELHFGTEKQVVEKWRAALAEAANLSGWHHQIAANRSEANLIQNIIKTVLHNVNWAYLDVPNYQVGLDSRISVLHSLLGIGMDDVRMIGVYGMGGVGKTTLAMNLYNSIVLGFECSCFLANVREECEQPNGLCHLQEQLLCEMLKKETNVSNVYRGSSVLKERLTGKRVLIVLDDVNQIQQIDLLVGQGSRFGPGSRIILTTRDRHLLDEAGVDETYEAEELNYNDSLGLFSWHAFKQPTPLWAYSELSDEIVSYARGLPLALEVLGCLLVKRNQLFWRSTLEKLKHIPPNKIVQVLRTSFDSLDDQKEKDMFLDIACFFNGMDKENAMKIFDACGFFADCGLTKLIDRCLLKISSGNRLRMHDLICDMGREIVREKFPEDSGKHTRLWQQEVICDLLSNDEATEAVQGIILDLPLQKQFSTRPFAKMPNLRLLQINNVKLDGSFEGLFKKLRWLCWHKCPMESLPREFHPAKLVFLDMQLSNLKTLWQGTQSLSDLKILNISESRFLTTTPDFSGLQNLEELRFEWCHSLSNIDNSIGALHKLITLCLKGCMNLKSLPSSMGYLKSLVELDVSMCSQLEELPEQLSNLKGLRKLNSSYSGIKLLPHSIGHLVRLYALDLRGCKNLKSLPTSICNLRLLKGLELNRCSNLEALPDRLGEMKGLKCIDASGSRIKDLPDSIGNLEKLSALWLMDCQNLKSLSASIHNLRSLEYINLTNCPNLELLPGDIAFKRCVIVGKTITRTKQLLDSVGSLDPPLDNLPSSSCNLRSLEDVDCSKKEWLSEDLGNLNVQVNCRVHLAYIKEGRHGSSSFKFPKRFGIDEAEESYNASKRFKSSHNQMIWG